jgi:hypothetical protein
MLLKQVAVHMMKGEYRIWQQNFGTHQLFMLRSMSGVGMFTDGTFRGVEQILTRSPVTLWEDCYNKLDYLWEVILEQSNCFVERVFGIHFTLRGLRPPQSPDLSLPYFILWRFVTERVYSNNPQSLEEWKGTFGRNDPQQIRNFSQKELKLVDASLSEGSHIFCSCSKAVI